MQSECRLPPSSVSCDCRLLGSVCVTCPKWQLLCVQRLSSSEEALGQSWGQSWKCHSRGVGCLPQPFHGL